MQQLHYMGQVATRPKRVQVLLEGEFATQVEDLAKAEHSSMSKVISDCFKEHTYTSTYQERLTKAREKLDEAKNEILKILGQDTPDDKIRQVLQVLNKMD